VNKSIEHIENITGRLRTIASGLMPAVLLDKGPVIAVQQFIRHLQLSNSIRVSLHTADLPRFTQQTNIHLYRIMQEIIHNCCKHAGASRLHIRVYQKGNNIILATADDGTGFDYEDVMRQKKGYGLLNIQNRVQLLNGNCNMQTTGGTRYFIEIPHRPVIKNEYTE